MMLFLVSDIADDPPKISRSKADHTIVRLPLKQMAIGDSMIDVVGAGSLHLPDPVTDQQRWWHAYDQVHVILNAANPVKYKPGVWSARSLRKPYRCFSMESRKIGALSFVCQTK